MVCQHIIGFLDILLFYLSCGYIWLYLLVDDHYFWNNIKQSKKNIVLCNGIYLLLLTIESKHSWGVKKSLAKYLIDPSIGHVFKF